MLQSTDWQVHHNVACASSSSHCFLGTVRLPNLLDHRSTRQVIGVVSLPCDEATAFFLAVQHGLLSQSPAPSALILALTFSASSTDLLNDISHAARSWCCVTRPENSSRTSPLFPACRSKTSHPVISLAATLRHVRPQAPNRAPVPSKFEDCLRSVCGCV